MKVIISNRDKYIRKDIAGKLRANYPNSDTVSFDDPLLAAKSVYTGDCDVIIMGVEGIKLIPMLKKHGGPLTIVILASNDSHRDEAFSSGADAYIREPLRDDELFSAVEGRLSTDLFET